jgi:hypothetical protein
MVQLAAESVNALFAQPAADGSFGGAVLRHLRTLGSVRRSVILCFPPKAAGTFFRTAVLYAVDGQLVRTVHAQGGRDAQLYLPTFVAYYSGAVTPRVLVGHVHMQALPANTGFIEAFDLHPIAMIRSIPDMLASYRDMLESDPESLKEGLNGPIPEHFRELSGEAKADFLIDMLGPWYVGYYATWMRYAAGNPERVCVLRYGEFRSDPARALMRAVAHSRLARTRAQCQAALDRAWGERERYRYNKGEEGRGARYFAPRHIERLARMIGAYPHLAPHAEELLAFAPSPLARAV